jgi:hypothetical protein
VRGEGLFFGLGLFLFLVGGALGLGGEKALEVVLEELVFGLFGFHGFFVLLLELFAFLLEGLLHVLDALLEAVDGMLELGALLLELLDLALHFVLLLLGEEGFAHSVGDGAFVEGLVRLDGHAKFIAHSDEQEAPLQTLDGDLSYQLIYRSTV